MKLFSGKSRPVHLGPYPLEKLRRLDTALPALPDIPFPTVSFASADHPQNIINAMGPFQAMMDALRSGTIAQTKADIPTDPLERAQHLKAFGYYNDASMMGICAMPQDAILTAPRRNDGVAALVEDLKRRQTTTLATGIDAIMADLRETAGADHASIADHTHAIVVLTAFPRDPLPGEAGCDWITDAQQQRAALRATENATVLAEYIRILGFDARAHSVTSSDIHLPQLALASGLTVMQDGIPQAPWLAHRFGLAAITTNMTLAADLPLKALDSQPASVLRGHVWQLGTHGGLNARSHDPYAKRNFVDGPHPFETLKRVDSPTTYIDAANVPRVPKRTDMFARGQFGDMGPKVQDAMKGGQHIVKSAPAAAQRRLLGALILLQDGAMAATQTADDPDRNAANLKAAAYFLALTPRACLPARTGRGTAMTPPAAPSPRPMITRLAS